MTATTSSTGQTLRQRLVSHGAVVGGLCLGIAALLTAISGRGFWSNLGYSVCIGLVCTATVGLTMHLAQRLSAARQRRAGQPAAAHGVHSGWAGVIPGSLLAVLLGPTLGMWLGDQVTGKVSPSLLQWRSSTMQVTLLLCLLGTLIAVAVLSALERLAAARAQAEAAQRLATETQLRLLQSQLEPHMLFNTLANLRVLIGLDAQRAQGMLDHIISYLRATLQASRHDSHPLAAEFDRLRDYLALMAVRMGPRLQVDLQLPEALRNLPVPPLLLQPLVENAIQHGLEPKVAGGRLQVRASADAGQLCLQVRDTGLGLGAVPSTGTGFGVGQVRQRLATLYGERAQLRLQAAPDDDGGVLATVTLPLPTKATPA
jgi:signal transduction histidine kinase